MNEVFFFVCSLFDLARSENLSKFSSIKLFLCDLKIEIVIIKSVALVMCTLCVNCYVIETPSKNHFRAKQTEK